MFVIFLDIDGVLVNRKSLRQASGLRAPFDPGCVNALNAILRETGADIVITSGWRKHIGYKELENMLEAAGMDIRPDGPVIGQVPLVLGDRWSSIESWIQAEGLHRVDDLMVIIGDDHVGGILSQVKTDTETGLTMDNAFEAIAILKGQAA